MQFMVAPSRTRTSINIYGSRRRCWQWWSFFANVICEIADMDRVVAVGALDSGQDLRHSQLGHEAYYCIVVCVEG